ncbi:hypothetical protein L7F22_041822 [Adiantum nelumboides]|nr:hypothetical protein [Adiantum nelumboides]
MVERWDPIWQPLNASFESKLVGEWTDLQQKTFFVWDGNHRLKTWMKHIEEVYYENEQYHPLVRCQFIEIDKKKEAELILSLDTTNEIARATAIPNLGHEIFMFQKFGLANKHSIMEHLTVEQRSWMEIELKLEARHNQGMTPWYSTPCILISQLVWKSKWEHFLSKEDSKLRSMDLSIDEHKQKLDDAIKRMEEILRDNGYKYLSIANPLHGEEFFSMLFKKDWSDKSMIGITKDKLYSLCSVKIIVERHKELLHTMILTKAKDPKATHLADYKKFRFYMRQEAYWQGMFEEATLIIAKPQVKELELPTTFDGFFKTSHKVHVTQAYNTILSTMKSASDCATLPEVLQASKRFVYRWLHECMQLKAISFIPIDTHEWVDKNDENTMFSATIVEKGITSWDCSHCPWWLKYPLGVVPKSEKAIHDSFLNKHREKVITSRFKSKDKDVSQESWDCSHCPWWLKYPLGVVPKSEKAIHDSFLNKHREKVITSRFKSKDKDVSQESTSKKKKKLPKKKVDFHTPESDDNDEEESLPSPSQCVMQESKSRGASKSIILSSFNGVSFSKFVGDNIFTYVDALLLDIESIDDFAWHYIETWFQRVGSCYEKEYHLKGEASEYVARLIFANFPTSMLVFGVQDSYAADYVEGDIPVWNQFSTCLVRGVMDIADMHLANEGFLVTLSLVQHLGRIESHTRIFGLHLHRSWTLMCDGGDLHRDTREQVLDLTIGLFYRKISTGVVPRYDRGAGEFVSFDMFPAKRSYLSELPTKTKSEYTHVDELMVQGAVERTPSFFSWMLATFTDEDDHVLDLFMGCGALCDACSKEMQHCLMLEGDYFVFSECL